MRANPFIAGSGCRIVYLLCHGIVSQRTGASGKPLSCAESGMDSAMAGHEFSHTCKKKARYPSRRDRIAYLTLAFDHGQST
jgi:hypothetical protein